MDFDAYLTILPRLDALLRREGIAPGQDLWQSVYDLLLRLRQQGRWPADPELLPPLLGPLLCRSPAQQAVFPRLHQEALTGKPPQAEPAVVGSEAGRALQHWRARLDDLDRRWRQVSFALLLLLLGAAAMIVLWPPNPITFNPDQIKSSDPRAAAAQQDVKDPVQPNATSIPIVDRVAPNLLPQPTGFPEKWRQLQSAIGYAAWGLPWLMPLLWVLRQAARRLRFRRAQSPAPALLRDLRFELPLHPLFGGPEAERNLRGLRPVLYRSSRKLDVTATAAATAHHAGYFQPRYRARRIVPVYLLLVRSLDRDDQRAALAEELAARFTDQGVKVHRYRFREDPRWLVRWERDQPARPVELKTLANEFGEAGLIVLSETEILFHPKGHPRAWIEAFRDWPRRVWLHPRDAGPAQTEVLWRNDFLMLPLARHALGPLVRWLTAPDEATLPPAAADDLSLPDAIADEPEAWLAPHPPYGADLDSLPWQLERFLGTQGLLLLRAVAVYPEPHWPLTLALDFLLFAERDGGRPERREQRLSRLSRLPWLRQAYLPQYLRERLVADTDPDDRRQIRDAWARLFGQLAEGRGRLSLSVATPVRRTLRALLRDLVGTRHEPALRDPIFLDLLTGRRLGLWDVPIAERIARRLPGRPRRLDLRILPLLAAAGFAGWGLSAVWDLWGKPWLTGVWKDQIAAENARWPVSLQHGPSTAELADTLDENLRRSGFTIERKKDLADVAPQPNTIRHSPLAREAAERLAYTLTHLSYGAVPALQADPEISGIAVRLSQTHQAGSGFRDVLAFTLSTRFSDALKDGGKGPEMVTIPAGTFLMGSPADEMDRSGDEGPQHRVTIAQPFALGRTEVTFDDYDRFAKATGRTRPGDSGWGRGGRPVINVTFDDAQAYADWLSAQTGRRYRLPTEAEWEYAARAGTRTAYWWGNEIGRNRANCADCGSQWDGKETAPAGSFAANAFGLYDTAGNVYEWAADCWHGSFQGAPGDGSAWLEAAKGECDRRVVRGGSWSGGPRGLRSASRSGGGTDGADGNLGFRLARDL